MVFIKFLSKFNNPKFEVCVSSEIDKFTSIQPNVHIMVCSLYWFNVIKP